MVVRSEDVDEAVEALRVLAAHVGRVSREVGRRPVGADEHAVLLVAVGRRPRPERAVLLERIEQRDRLRNLGLDDALALEGVEVDPKALQRSLDRREHPRDRVALLLRELRDVLAVVAVLGRLLASPHGVDRGAEPVHLSAGVVVVVLALDGVAGEREQPGDAVAVGAVPGRGHGDRARRVRGHHLDLNALGRRLRSRRRTRSPAASMRRESLGEPGVVEVEVDEPGTGDLGCADAVERRRGRPRAPRRPHAAARFSVAGEPQGDVGRVVAVGGVGRALECDRHAGDLGEGSAELLQRISRQRFPRRRRRHRFG